MGYSLSPGNISLPIYSSSYGNFDMWFRKKNKNLRFVYTIILPTILYGVLIKKTQLSNEIAES